MPRCLPASDGARAALGFDIVILLCYDEKIMRYTYYNDINFFSFALRYVFLFACGAMIVGGFVPVSPAVTAPSCPLSSQSGRTIITFNGATLNPNAKLNPVLVSIPSGTYDITLVSYDDHAAETSTQPNEQWYVIAKNSSGAPVAVSGSIADLANGQDMVTQTVNTDFRVSSAIASINAYHIVQDGSTEPNSVVPLCAAFDAKGKIPVVSTNEASYVTNDSATLYGYVNPVGTLDTVRWFEWGTSTSLGSKTQEIPQGTAPSSFSFRVTTLAPDTTYYFRAAARNSQGSAYDATLNFYTKGAAEYTPFVSTDPASSFTESSAMLNGYVNPNGSSETVRWFEWGTTTALGSKTQEIAVGSAATNISQALSGLNRSTTYYAKALARNGKGTSEGGIIVFQTLPITGTPGTTYPTTSSSGYLFAPTAVTKTATFIAQNTAVLNGLALADTGVPTNGWFEWGTSPNLEYQTAHHDLGYILSTDFADSLIGLRPGTVYYYRATVENVRGRSSGVTFLFRTLSTGGVPSQSSSPQSSVSLSSPKPPAPKVHTYVPNLGQIALSIVPSSEVVSVGKTVRFTITFENKVKDFLSDVFLTVTLPPELSYNQLTGIPAGIEKSAVVDGQIITLPVGDMIAGDKGTLVMEATLKRDTPDKKIFTTVAEITYINTTSDVGGKETAFAINTADASWHWWLLLFAGGFWAWLLWGMLGLLLLALLLLLFWKRRKEKEEDKEI